MKRVSSNEKEIAKVLNSKREKAYIDIYKENDFYGLGILVDKELHVYEYNWKIIFNKEYNSFSNDNILLCSEKKINYKELEEFLLRKLRIIEKKYSNNENRNIEVIRLKNYEAEFQNSELYDNIKKEIEKLLKEDL